MSTYMMVDTISQFRMRYVIEVPDEVGLEHHPATPEDYAMDMITCEEAKEFTQHHLGETIVSTREVTLEEAIDQFRKDEPMLGESWDDTVIVKNAITPIGHSEQEKMKQEEERWNREHQTSSAV